MNTEHPPDAEYMQLALNEAAKGLGRTSPNPPVGCVIVRDGEIASEIVGRGFHPQAGEPHAEVFALREAGERARGAIAYVTLEPCSHFGRTPPCADALIAAGVEVDHVNRLGWTALLEAIVLSDGGPAHQDIVGQLIAAGADVNLPDHGGVTPLAHAEQRGQQAMAALLRAAGAR